MFNPEGQFSESKRKRVFWNSNMGKNRCSRNSRTIKSKVLIFSHTLHTWWYWFVLYVSSLLSMLHQWSDGQKSNISVLWHDKNYYIDECLLWSTKPAARRHSRPSLTATVPTKPHLNILPSSSQQIIEIIFKKKMQSFQLMRETELTDNEDGFTVGRSGWSENPTLSWLLFINPKWKSVLMPQIRNKSKHLSRMSWEILPSSSAWVPVVGLSGDMRQSQLCF